MKREIKFRAWDSKSQRMYYQGEPDLEDIQSFFHHYNDNDELMQFTGLRDKNGKEIYEGDILKHRGHHRMEASVVVFSDGCFNVGYHYGSSTKVKPMLINSKVEIIGNIHENPELLK